MMPKPSLPGILGIGDRGFGYWGSGFGHRVRTLMPKTGARVEKLVRFRVSKVGGSGFKVYGVSSGLARRA